MSELTTHSNKVRHSRQVPHKRPKAITGTTKSLKSLSTQLYPTGRAWRQASKTSFQKVHESINDSLERAIIDSESVIESSLPDNEGFSEQDAANWEYYLGMIDSSNIDIAERRRAISRKMGYPNGVRARQHYLFIQSQLQAAGFNVFVHENTLPFRTPDEVASIKLGNVQHGGDTQHGPSTVHGGESFSVIANSIDEFEQYSIGGNENLWATFFIGGENLGDSAFINSKRLKEFRETVIKLKPAHTVAFLFINFT